MHKFFYVLSLGLLCAFGPLCTDVYLPGLPSICGYFSIDPAFAQLSLTSCFLGLAAGQIFAGPISDAIGRRKPLIFSVVLFVLASWLCAEASGIYSLIFFRFLQGMAGAGGLVMSRAIACDKFQGAELTRFMSLLMTINSVAPVLGPIIGSFLLTFSTWQSVFIVLACFGIILLLLSFSSVPESLEPQKRQQHIAQTFKGMFAECTNKRFMLYVLSLGTVMGGFFSYLSASPFVFQVIFSSTPFQYSLIFASIAISISATAFAAGRLAPRVGERKMIYIAMSLMIISASAVLFMSFYLPSSPVPVIIFLMIFCSMMGTCQTVGFGIVMSSRKGGAGAASGIFGVMHFFCGALMTPVPGLMGENSMIPLGLCLISCALLALILFKAADGMRIKPKE